MKNSGMGKLNVLVLLAAIAGSVSGFTSCSSGSGSSNTPNVINEPPRDEGGFVYQGPAPGTDDVQEFKINVWDNLVAENRCGSCHQQGGSGQGAFVRTDDINLAYAAANPLIDLSLPANSLLVTKVASDHNCWLSDANACADIITGWISDWADASGSVANVVTLTAPEFHPVQDSRSFPADVSASEFESTVYPLLRSHCSTCHAEDAGTPQSPFFASADPQFAYSKAWDKIDLGDVERIAAGEAPRSRFIVRLRDEFHNCWSNCAANADAMQEQILAFAGDIPVTEVDPELLTSGALTLLGDGIVASSGGRIESDVIALYTFKPPSNDSVGKPISQVFDVSGVGQAADLRAFGDDVTWVGGWGARFGSGRLQGSAPKLHELITATGEYSIEAWVVPANVEQDDSARIVTYAGGGITGNNFALGQSAYNYDFLQRSASTDAEGMPAFSTDDDAQVLQASLQHVVLTSDPVAGRRIFVNGEDVSPGADPQAGGNLADWDSSFALALGQNAGGGDQWQGTLRLLAIHNRALSPADIRNNFEVGVGEKFYLLFDLSRTSPALVDMPQAFVGFEVEQFDSYGYLFKNPFFISLDPDAQPGSIVLRGMRIGLNGRELEEGQAYAKLNATITNASYASNGQTLSTFGTLIPIENGPELDQFFLTFDHIGSHSYNRMRPPTPPLIQPPLASEDQALVGVRHFEEINAALSQMTGVATSHPSVQAVFNTVRQQLPADEAIDGFLPAHQMGVTQLAVSYCGVLARDSGLRATYFPDFSNWNVDSATAFGAPGSAGRSAIVDPILKALIAHSIPGDDHFPHQHLASQPDPQDVSDELNALIDELRPSSTVENIVTSVCAAAMGSAIFMIQ